MRNTTTVPNTTTTPIVVIVLTCGLALGLFIGQLVPQATSWNDDTVDGEGGGGNDHTTTVANTQHDTRWKVPMQADVKSNPRPSDAAQQRAEAVKVATNGAKVKGPALSLQARTDAGAARVWPLPGGGPPNLHISDGTATRVGGELCMVTEGDGGMSTDRRFEVVLLSTFPRSGNSWTKMLVKGGTQITYDLSTVRPTPLLKIEELVQCASCAASTIGLYMQGALKIRFDRRPFEVAMGHKVPGIGQDNQDGHRNVTQECAASFLAHKWMQAAGQAWPFGPDQFAPVMIKSHYPMIGEGDAKKISYFATKIIHLVRNPFDNMASRYMGEGRKFKGRFNALTRAVAKGNTTDVFERFLAKDIEGYVHFHEYWLERRNLDIVKGISTFYTRYESMCSSTKTVMTNMLKFGGWNITQPSFACTLNEIPCEYNLNEMPGHIDIFSDSQIDFIMSKTSHLLDAFGYVLDRTGKRPRLTLAPPLIPMCLG